MNDNVEYKKVEETKDSYKKQLYWNMAIGLQQVDGLTPSSYLKELVSKNIKGEIINYEVEESLHTYYKTQDLSNIKILKDNTVIYADYNEIENAYKYETFIFDIFSYVDKIGLLKGKREEIFAPVKNKEGVDSPETAANLYNKIIK